MYMPWQKPHDDRAEKYALPQHALPQSGGRPAQNSRPVIPVVNDRPFSYKQASAIVPPQGGIAGCSLRIHHDMIRICRFWASLQHAPVQKGFPARTFNASVKDQ
jgi:hypothetical protein